MAVGTVTFSTIEFSSTKEMTITWTSDGSGDASANTDALMDGQILGVVTLADSSNVANPPSANFDIFLKHPTYNDFDFLMGYGQNRSTTAIQAFTPVANSATYSSYAMPVVGQPNFVVKGAGASKNGICLVYYR